MDDDWRMVSLLLSPAERYQALLASGNPHILARVPSTTSSASWG